MSTGADVRDIPALREWLAALQVYQHDAGEALGGIRIEIHRGREWVSRQLDLWQRAARCHGLFRPRHELPGSTSR